MSPRGPLLAGRWPHRTEQTGEVCHSPVCQLCPALPSPLRQVVFTNGLVMTVPKVGQREEQSRSFAFECCMLGCGAHTCPDGWLGLPQARAGIRPRPASGLGKGPEARPIVTHRCWLGSLPDCLVALFTGRAGHPPKGIFSSGQARQLHQPHTGCQGARGG